MCEGGAGEDKVAGRKGRKSKGKQQEKRKFKLGKASRKTLKITGRGD